MVAPTSVIELIPRLATSLGQIRRVPGKGDAWISHVTEALAKVHDPRHDKMRRRIGFAQRLGTIAGLSDLSASRATLGLFFHELLPAKSNGARGARPWRDYLLRNEEWLRPALEICDAIDNATWDDLSEEPGIVAKVAATYDEGTLERHERPLAVVEAMLADVGGSPAQRIVDLLWTEDGQALCDHHFRRHPRGYRLDPKEIKVGLARLYRVTPRIAADVALQSMRYGDASPEQHAQEDGHSVARTSTKPDVDNNFDRRKSALRARKEDVEMVSAPSQPSDLGNGASVAIPTGIEAKLREMEARERQREASAQLVGEELAGAPEMSGTRREERMSQMTTVAAAGHNDALDVREKLQELRLQLGQIQQIALQAEQVLAGIAPQIDEFAARIADVEAVMDRWSGRGRAAA